ncbi:tyrosinase family protein, partial [Streptomyces purpureus]
MTVRKNQALLTAAEKKRFVDAVLELKRNGQYDTFVTTHNAFIMGDTDTGDRVGHRSPSFLPWHRRFLIQFEQALQAVDPAVALPYWDWTADRTARSSLWAPDFLGGTGRTRDGQVMDGPFARSANRWAVTVRVDGRDFLRRDLGAGGRQLP